MVFAIFRVVYRGSNGKNPYERNDMKDLETRLLWFAIGFVTGVLALDSITRELDKAESSRG
jgi:hypothetical protein